MSAALAYSYKSSCSPLRVVYKAKRQTHDPRNRLLDYNMDRKPLRIENRGHGMVASVNSHLQQGFNRHVYHEQGRVEHFVELNLIHMPVPREVEGNGRVYDPKLHQFLAPDNHIQDPYNSMSYDRFGYVWNNPLGATDASGEIIESILIGALIGVVTNGLNNLSQGNAFFAGGLRAALMGAVSGALSFGIGEAAAEIKGILLSTGISKASAFQFMAHATLGGVMSTVNGGKFVHGFISGGVGSLAGGIGNKLLGHSFVGTTL